MHVMSSSPGSLWYYRVFLRSVIERPTREREEKDIYAELHGKANTQNHIQRCEIQTHVQMMTCSGPQECWLSSGVVPEPPCDREAALRSLEELLGSSQLTLTARTILSLEEWEVRDSVMSSQMPFTSSTILYTFLWI